MNRRISDNYSQSLDDAHQRFEAIRSEIVPKMQRAANAIHLSINPNDTAGEDFDAIYGDAFGVLGEEDEVPEVMLDEQREVFNRVNGLLSATGLDIEIDSIFEPFDRTDRVVLRDPKTGMLLASDSERAGEELRTISFEYCPTPEKDVAIEYGDNNVELLTASTNLRIFRSSNEAESDLVQVQTSGNLHSELANHDYETAEQAIYFAQLLSGDISFMPLLRAGVIRPNSLNVYSPPIKPLTEGWATGIEHIYNTIDAIQSSGALDRLVVFGKPTN